MMRLQLLHKADFIRAFILSSLKTPCTDVVIHAFAKASFDCTVLIAKKSTCHNRLMLCLELVGSCS